MRALLVAHIVVGSAAYSFSGVHTPPRYVAASECVTAQRVTVVTPRMAATAQERRLSAKVQTLTKDVAMWKKKAATASKVASLERTVKRYKTDISSLTAELRITLPAKAKAEHALRKAEQQLATMKRPVSEELEELKAATDKEITRLKEQLSVAYKSRSEARTVASKAEQIAQRAQLDAADLTAQVTDLKALVAELRSRLDASTKDATLAQAQVAQMEEAKGWWRPSRLWSSARSRLIARAA